MSYPRFVVNRAVVNPPSARLTALLEFVKNEPGEDLSWRTVPKALGALYHPSMTLADVMHHLVHAHMELMADPRFEAGNPDNEPLAMLLAPVKGLTAIELFGPKSTDNRYSVEQFYDAMALHMLCAVKLCRIDWLRAPAAPAAHAPTSG